MAEVRLDFYDIEDQGGFESWEPYGYGYVPNIGDLVFFHRDYGADQLWRVEDRVVYPSRVELFCRFHQELRGPTIKVKL